MSNSLIDGSELTPEAIPFESQLLEEIFDIYDITPRFADFLTRQHMPGRAVHHIPGTRNLARHGILLFPLPSHDHEPTNTQLELWYSAVIRTHEDYKGNRFDRSRLVVNWQRMCVWASYSTNGDATFLILRCPSHIKAKLYDAFAGPAGTSLLNHPMLLHAFLAEQLVLKYHLVV
jgi:hypothetical protein